MSVLPFLIVSPARCVLDKIRRTRDSKRASLLCLYGRKKMLMGLTTLTVMRTLKP